MNRKGETTFSSWMILMALGLAVVSIIVVLNPPIFDYGNNETKTSNYFYFVYDDVTGNWVGCDTMHYFNSVVEADSCQNNNTYINPKKYRKEASK